jgi:hypothetical protein
LLKNSGQTHIRQIHELLQQELQKNTEAAIERLEQNYQAVENYFNGTPSAPHQQNGNHNSPKQEM